MKRTIICILMVLVLVMVTSIPVVTASTFMTPQLSLNEVIAKVDAYSNQKIIDTCDFDDGSTIITRTNNGKVGSLYITTHPNGSVKYDYYDVIHNIMYTVEAQRDLSKSANKRSLLKSNKLTVCNLSTDPRFQTEIVIITDDEDALISEAVEAVEEVGGNSSMLRQELDSRGLTDIVFTKDVDSGSYFFERAEGLSSRAATKKCNPTMQSVKKYFPAFSYSLQDSASRYHAGLKQTISSKVYKFAKSYTQKVVAKETFKAAASSIALTVAAAKCLTTLSAFKSILSFFGVAFDANNLNDNIVFLSEQYWTYTGEKSGWTYDYNNPKGSGRYNGYVKTYPNSSTGKITMTWDYESGTNKRYNFQWKHTVHPSAYDTANSTILQRAYEQYSGQMVLYGERRGLGA